MPAPLLNYMGAPVGGQGPIAGTLPSGPQGTMPAGIPGVQPTPQPPPPIQIGRPALPPHMQGAIAHHPAPPMGAPPKENYIAVTQDDGSILLHLKLPSGLPGPVVRLIPPVRHPNSPPKQQPQ